MELQWGMFTDDVDRKYKPQLIVTPPKIAMITKQFLEEEHDIEWDVMPTSSFDVANSLRRLEQISVADSIPIRDGESCPASDRSMVEARYELSGPKKHRLAALVEMVSLFVL